MNILNRHAAILAIVSALTSSAYADDVHIQNVLKMRNDTGQDANDLHIQARLPASDAGITVDGVNATSGDWGSLATNIPPDNRGFSVNATLGNTPNGGFSIVDLDILISEKNFMYCRWDWTRDGLVTGGGTNGWEIGDPMPGGGGLGGPENRGGGGGIGYFIHHIIKIVNDGDASEYLHYLNAYASMALLSRPDTLYWG